MIWADRIAIAVGAVIFILAALLFHGSDPNWGQVLWYAALDGGYFGLPAWVMLRVVDFAGGGPMRRKARKVAKS